MSYQFSLKIEMIGFGRAGWLVGCYGIGSLCLMSLFKKGAK
jgi:hypothetical protein